MKAVIYARVSDDDRQDGRSVGEQEQECRTAAAELGWTVDEVFTDNDRSASRYARKAREGHTHLLAHLRTVPVDVLILWESSRGDRELERWAGLLNLCRDRGVRIHVASHGRTYDLEQPRDWKTLAEDGVSSAFESDQTRQRVLRAVRANAAKGRPHGKLAYGYAREYDERGTFVRQYAKQDEAAIIRECARRVAAGDALYAVAQDLNVRQVPAPRGGKWIPTQVKRLVTNPRYVGQRVHRGVVVGEALWPAILDEKVWAECVRRMADPRRNTVRDTSLKHLLSGSLKAPCGGRTRVLSNRGYATYVCHDDYCIAVRTTYVEDFVTEMMIGRLERPDVLQLLGRSDGGAAASALAGAEADEKQLRLDGFVDAAAAGNISPAALARIEARLVPEIQDARRRAKAAPVSKLVRDVAGPQARQRWHSLTIGQRRELIDDLVELRVSRTVRGSRFGRQRLADSRWVGADRTWGEIWAEDPELA